MGHENRAVDPFDLRQTPKLQDLFRAFGRAWKLGIRTHVPATVVAFNPATSLVTVNVDMLQVVKVLSPERIPVRALSVVGIPPNAEAVMQPVQLTDIPCHIYGTQLNYVSVPIITGVTGMLHVSDRAMERWMLTGTPSDPGLAFTHALKDSIFYPGTRPLSRPLALPVDLTATVVEGALVKNGRLAVESATKASSLVTALVTAVSTAATGSMDGGATFKANLAANLATILAQISATKTLVE